MCALSRRIPKCRRHKTGQAFVQIKGRRIYLGKYGTPAADSRYRQIIAEMVTTPERPPSVGRGITIIELSESYSEHVERWYVKDGRPTSEQDNIRQAIRFLLWIYEHLPAIEFGPVALKAVRQRMIDHGRSRPLINKDINRIRQMFRWASSEEILPVTVYQALLTLPPLLKGRTKANEPEPIGPAAIADVDAALIELSPTLQAMVRLQLLTGCRPGEVCSLRPRDVTISTDDVWCYRPESHKTEHHGKERRIYFGPQAQEVLRPFLDRDPDQFCFRPKETVDHFNATKRENRRSPRTPSQERRGRKCHPKKHPGERYTKDSYRRAIARACWRVELKKRIDVGETRAQAVAAIKAEGFPAWSPNQLRHSRATELRARYGIEVAQLVLGHSDPKTTLIYAERDFEKASQVMREIG